MQHNKVMFYSQAHLGQPMELIHAKFYSNTTDNPLDELAKAVSRWIASTFEGEKFFIDQGSQVCITDLMNAGMEKELEGFGIKNLEINRLPFRVHHIIPESSPLHGQPLECEMLEKSFFITDYSGRGYTVTKTLRQISEEDWCDDDEDLEESETLQYFLESSELGEEFDLQSRACKIKRIT